MEKTKKLPNIRIRKITLTDFRNIAHAEVEIPGGKMEEFTAGESSVLGIYGQNGSGKTTLITAISVLSCALGGGEFFFPIYESCIRNGCERAKLEFEFSAFEEDGTEYDLYYAFSMKINKDKVNPNRNLGDDVNEVFDYVGFGQVISDQGKQRINAYFDPQGKRIVIYDEILQFAMTSKNGEKSNKQILIDTSEKACKISGKTFGNKTKYEQLTENCTSEIDEYLYTKKIEAGILSTSFVFSPDVVPVLIQGTNRRTYKTIIETLANYGQNNLFFVMTSQNQTNTSFILPLFFWVKDDEGIPHALLKPLNLIEPCKATQHSYPHIKKAIKSISQVISCIVPGLSIEISEIDKALESDGITSFSFELLSVRNGDRVPLRFESDGIRRIVSLLCILIAAYNNPSVTIAIDEMDSGIFEYMLGELLAIMKESAKGQIIFTSHNLRPLEVLPHKNLLFTTVNPSNRFTKLEGISGNNNLRDSYFRSIILGGGKDAFYDSTDTFKIEQAMYEAGHSMED